MSILQRLGRGSVRVHTRGYFAERVIQRAAGWCKAAAQPLNSPRSPSAEPSGKSRQEREFPLQNE